MILRARAGSRVIDFVLAAALAASSLPAFAAETHDFNVPAEDAPTAIRDFASQAHVQILAAGENVKDKRLRAVNGEYSTDQGLHILLADSGLSPQYVGNRSIALVPASNLSASEKATGADGAKEGTKREQDSFRLAQTTPESGQAPSAVANMAQRSSGNSQGQPQLQEVIVTARKREELLQEVPVPVTVVDTRQLTDNNQTSLKDYYNTIPGLSISQIGSQDYQTIFIRGISTGTGFDPTVGVTLDDEPFGAFTNVGGGNQLPDIDPSDLERIEVLRGPQGSLYGTNSMGGLIRYVTKDPTTAGFSGSVTAGTSAVQNGAEPGYNFRASANAPLSDDLAFRISGYTRQDPGYIDDPVHNISGINEDRASGGMLSVKWTPTDSLSIKLRALAQHSSSDGASDVTIGLGDLQQNFAPGVGGDERWTQSYSAVVNAKFGTVDMTSVSGYNIVSQHYSSDFTYIFGNFPPFNNPYAPWYGEDANRSFSQELRFSGSLGPSVDWLGGGFYAYQKPYSTGAFYAGSASGELITALDTYDTQVRYSEYAGFGTITYHFTDQFDVQVGGRETHFDTKKWETDAGYIYGGVPTFVNDGGATADVFTYLVTPRLKLTPDLMLYARVATGYRPGGGNGMGIPGEAPIPPSYSADRTENYELGVKADVLNHRLSIDTSVYYITWKNIQLYEYAGGGIEEYVGNAGGAKSEGVELAVTARPLSGLTVAGWADYDDAVLTKATPSGVYGLPGFMLPYVGRWSGNLSAQQEFPLSTTITGFVGAVASYVDNRLGEFATSAATPERQQYPAYTQINLRGGAKYDAWTVNLFANNVTDRRGLLGGGIGGVPPTVFQIIQPRTVGLNISRSF